MGINQWFKFYGSEYLSDPKISSLTPQERSCWLTLLCLSSISSTPGTVEYLTVEALLQKSGIVWDPYNPEEWDAAKGVLDKFVRMKMIEKSEDGTISLRNWIKRQETNLTNAERQARFRANNAKITQPVTKVTLEKNREEKINTQNELSIPEKQETQSDQREVAVDADGNEIIPKSKKLPVFASDVRAAWNDLNTFRGSTPNPSVKDGLLPKAKDDADTNGAILRRRSRYSLEQFEGAFKAYASEVLNRKKDEKGYYTHRFTLYEFLTHKNVFERYATR